MSFFDTTTIRLLDTYFREAQNSFDADDFVTAYDKCDQIKRWVSGAQDAGVRRTTGFFVAGGVLAGFAAPGVGNVVGGTLGGVVGGALGKYLGRLAFREGGTIEEIVELATAGKQEAKASQWRKHKGQAPYNTQSEPFYQRWERVRQEVL